MSLATPSPINTKRTSAMDKHKRERIRYYDNVVSSDFFTCADIQ
jgi:hypothetical protein